MPRTGSKSANAVRGVILALLTTTAAAGAGAAQAKDEPIVTTHHAVSVGGRGEAQTRTSRRNPDVSEATQAPGTSNDSSHPARRCTLT
jgi:hypothetical protein